MRMEIKEPLTILLGFFTKEERMIVVHKQIVFLSSCMYKVSIKIF